MKHLALALCLAAPLGACIGGQTRSVDQKIDPRGAPGRAAGGSTEGAGGAIEDGDVDLVLSPEISKSRGEAGGIVLLYPRIIPSSERERLRGPAKALQDRLYAMLKEAYPDRPIDVRPEPERVCMRTGCLAPSVGVLIAAQADNCVAVAIVSDPGKSPQRLMPWAGLVTTALQVPFREPPESHIQIREFVACDALPVATLEREERVKEALTLR